MRVELLLSHARLTEGSTMRHSRANTLVPTTFKGTPKVHFNPLFASPTASQRMESPSTSRTTHETLGQTSDAPQSAGRPSWPDETISATKDSDSEQHAANTSSRAPVASVKPTLKSADSTQRGTSETQSDQLTELINSFVDKQRTLANGGNESSSKSMSTSDDLVSPYNNPLTLATNQTIR